MLNKICALIILLFSSSYVFATLGGDEKTVSNDLKALNSSDKTQITSLSNNGTINITEIKHNNNFYKVYSFNTDDNVTIKEYSLNKKIYAVSWHGQHLINLHQLIGTYFNNLKPQKNQIFSLRQVIISNDDIFYQNSILGGNYYGKAILKSISAPDINIKDIN